MMMAAKFIDELDIEVKGGSGGDGLVHFARFKYKPKGGPDGGDGGSGGSVYLVGESTLEGLEHLLSVKSHCAEDGAKGGPAKKAGKKGADLLVRVPLGSQIYDAQSKIRLAEIVRHGQKVLVASGGAGGRGNAKLATPRTRTPRFAEKGREGEQRRVSITYRAYANLALVEEPTSELTIMRKILAGNVGSPHRFFERPRIISSTVGFKDIRAVVIPLSIKDTGPAFIYLHHSYYADSLILNAVGITSIELLDSLWPKLIVSLQSLPHPKLKRIVFMAREDPGLPYEVSFADENGGAKVEVTCVIVPRAINDYPSFSNFVEEKLGKLL